MAAEGTVRTILMQPLTSITETKRGLRPRDGLLLVLVLGAATENIIPGTQTGLTLRMAVLPGNRGRKSVVRA